VGLEDPWSDADTLTRAVVIGIMDAPQLKNNKYARGEIFTGIVDGTCYATDPRSGKTIYEAERMERLLDASDSLDRKRENV
jgi:hypothetical protein